MIENIRLLFSSIALLFLFLLIFRKNQNERRNWAMFYSILYTSISLLIVNYGCVRYGFWEFNVSNICLIPFDIAFLWIVLWGILPSFFLEKKYFWIILLLIFWSDYLLMPELDKYNVLELQPNWLIGEFLLIFAVFIPSFWWGYISYYNKATWLRAVFQVAVMTTTFVFGLPFILYSYNLIEKINYSFNAIEFQFLLIISFPALVAVMDLVNIGKGTPFPYDKTDKLVTSGVYAYCRNPIQWSFTLMFIPLALYQSSWYLLIGSLVSVAYTIGVSDFQEYSDMEKRFDLAWLKYNDSTPKWYFQWVAKTYPKGTIYFNYDCGICSELATWYRNRSAQNLFIKNASTYKGEKLRQVTYVDHHGNEYKSVKAIANALEHINLAYASLGWLMRFPVLEYVFQALVDASGIDNLKSIE